MPVGINPLFETVVWTTLPNGWNSDINAWTLSLVAAPFPITPKPTTARPTADPDFDLLGTAWENWMANLLDGNKLEAANLKTGFRFQFEFLPDTPPGAADPTSSDSGNAIDPAALNQLPHATGAFTIPTTGETVKDPNKIWNMLFPDEMPSRRSSRRIVTRTPYVITASSFMTHRQKSAHDYAQELLLTEHVREMNHVRRVDSTLAGGSVQTIIQEIASRPPPNVALRRIAWLNSGSTPSDFVKTFISWLAANLGKAEGRRAERNLYRLSDHPYDELDDDAFAAAWGAIYPDYKLPDIPQPPTPDPLAALQSRLNDLISNRSDKWHLLRVTLFHRRVRKQRITKTYDFDFGDIADLKTFAHILINPPDADKVSPWLFSRLSEGLQKTLQRYLAGEGSSNVEVELDAALNSLIEGELIYNGATFVGVQLRPETEALRESEPSGAALKRLNRMLLEDAYPTILLNAPNFSQKIAMLNNYPNLMRRLGLIFDLSVAPSSASASWGFVRAIILDDEGKAAGHFPWTKITRSSSNGEAPFTPAKMAVARSAEDGLYYGRMLAASNLNVYVLDADSQTLKLTSQADSLTTVDQQSSEGNSAPPAPRSIGMAISLDGRGSIVNSQYGSAQKRLAASQADRDHLPAVGFEALVRGYVPYVRINESGPFFALCGRDEQYDFLTAVVANTPRFIPNYSNSNMPATLRNGFIPSAATTTYDTTTNDPSAPTAKDLHVHETILRWTGWSLVAPSPIAHFSSLDNGETPPSQTNVPSGHGPQVKSSFKTPDGSLPKLLFGNSYQFQILCMDMAGNVPLVDPAPDSLGTTAPKSYQRWDPVPPPEILLTGHLSASESPGEQLTQMVLRSLLTQDGEQAAKASYRAIVAPRCSFTLAREAGRFENLDPGDIGSFDELYLPPKGGGKFTTDYSDFNPGDFINLPKLAEAILDNSLLFSQQLQRQLSGSTIDELKKAGHLLSKNDDLLKGLSADLNTIILSRHRIFDDDGVNAIHQRSIRAQTLSLINQEPQGTDLVVLNRMLLEDAYNGLLAYGRQNSIAERPGDNPPSCLYLPDPFAEYLRIGIKDMTSGKRVLFSKDQTGSVSNDKGEPFLDMPFYDDSHSWPHARMYLLELNRQTGNSRDISVNVEQTVLAPWPFNQQRIVARVPCGTEVKFIIQSQLGIQNWKRMAVFTKASERIRERCNRTQLTAEVSAGIDDLSTTPSTVTTPNRVLGGVHAINMTRLAPAINSMTSTNRQLNQTFQAFDHVDARVERASCSKIQLQSSWEEWIDSAVADSPMPKRATKQQTLGEVNIAPPYSLPKQPIPVFEFSEILDLRGISNSLPNTPQFAAWLIPLLTKSGTLLQPANFPPLLSDQQKLASALVDDLNAIINAGPIDSGKNGPFAGFPLPPRTAQLRDWSNQSALPDSAQKLLSKFLFEAAFPTQLAQSATGSGVGWAEQPLGPGSTEGLWPTELRGTFPPYPGQIRHDFNDTRHRVVNYQLVASGRFADYFSTSQRNTINSAAFQLSILNSAIPPKPDVAYIIPAFSWKSAGDQSKTKVTERGGGGCRIWLNRPWHVTGENEQLGIVVWRKHDTEVNLSGLTRTLATRWGADPIRDDDADTLGMNAEDISSPMRKDSSVVMPVADANGTIQQLLTVVPLAPEYDRRYDLWFVDVQLTSLPSYFTFVRFALVRYQKYSIRNCMFSDVVNAQFIQLAPGRTITATKRGDFREVLLMGDNPNPSNTYSCQLQVARRLTNATWWRSDSEILAQGTGADPRILARWKIKINSDDDTPNRFVVREYEQFQQDLEVGNDKPSTTRAIKRLVFAGTLDA